jgi:hypothetical protein
MPHRSRWQGFGNLGTARLFRIAFVCSTLSFPGLPMITIKELIEYGSAGLVFASGGLAGHYASIGMTPVQWAGAIASVLGSVTVAVAVRVWTPVRAPQQD